VLSRPGEGVVPNILIIDDDPLMIEVLASMLEDMGKITGASTGEEGLRLATAEPPDLILLDVEMSGMDGFETIAALRANFALHDTPLIFVTAHSGTDFETRGLNAGAVDFIAKPFHPPIIRARVQTHLTLKQQADELRRLANVDGMTQVANRRAFDVALGQEWRRSLRTGQPLSLALIDVDHFKKYNDRYGHIAGDDCLRAVARSIKGAAKRSVDLVARYGGEEFTIILPGAAAEAAGIIGQRTLNSVSGLQLPHEASPTAPVVTISLGMATIDFDQIVPSHIEGGTSTKHLERITAVADGALYQAKSAGRNRMMSASRSALDLMGESGAP
jgi:diguanylate cyclase (GGDEF)-like protein